MIVNLGSISYIRYKITILALLIAPKKLGTL